MTTKTIHVPIGERCTTVTHQYQYLMQTFGIQTVKIPHHSKAFTIGHRVALLSMNEVRELFRIFDKENRCIIAHQIPVTIFSVEFQGKTTWVSFAVGSSFFATH